MRLDPAIDRAALSGRSVSPKPWFGDARGDGQCDGVTDRWPAQVLLHFAQCAAPDSQRGGHVEGSERIGTTSAMAVSSPELAGDAFGGGLVVVGEHYDFDVELVQRGQRRDEVIRGPDRTAPESEPRVPC